MAATREPTAGAALRSARRLKRQGAGRRDAWWSAIIPGRRPGRVGPRTLQLPDVGVCTSVGGAALPALGPVQDILEFTYA
jgi:hypothetical protein